MAKSTTASELLRLTKQLKAERAEHLASVASIDQVFAQLGLEVPGEAVAAPAAAPKKRGRPAGKKNALGKKKPATKKKVAGRPAKSGGRKRKKFPTSGDGSVLEFVKANAGCTTADVNAHWQKEGRAGKADNSLSKLTREKKIKRKNVKGSRGSTYSA